jgi:hypothetical protein
MENVITSLIKNNMDIENYSAVNRKYGFPNDNEKLHGNILGETISISFYPYNKLHFRLISYININNDNQYLKVNIKTRWSLSCLIFMGSIGFIFIYSLIGNIIHLVNTSTSVSSIILTVIISLLIIFECGAFLFMKNTASEYSNSMKNYISKKAKDNGIIDIDFRASPSGRSARKVK